MPRENDPVWLITGCSTGFGRELAKLTLERGWPTVATARRLAAVEDLAGSGPLLPLELDVGDQGRIAAVVDEAIARFGRIDVLVNNAGYGYLASIEEGEEAEIRAMFEANVFGLAAMTRAVLPHMRERRSGAIVNISSVGGFIGREASGYYAATKHAVNGLSSSLAFEVNPLGIKVINVCPGPFRTDWAGRSLRQKTPAIADYEPTVGKRLEGLAELTGRQPGDPVRAGLAIIEAVAAADPPLNLVLGADGLEVVAAKLDASRREIEDWRELGLSADYPANGGG